MGVYITEQIKLQILITFFLFEQKKGYFSKKKFFAKKKSLKVNLRATFVKYSTLSFNEISYRLEKIFSFVLMLRR